MGTAPVFASASEALDMVRSGLRFLAGADAAELTSEEQAEVLRGLTPPCARPSGQAPDGAVALSLSETRILFSPMCTFFDGIA